MGDVVSLDASRVRMNRLFTRREEINPPEVAAIAPASGLPRPPESLWAAPEPGAYLKHLQAAGLLSPKQARELALLTAAELATDPHMAIVLRRKADHVALGIAGRFEPLPDDDEATDVPAPFDAQACQPRSLLVWILAALGVAAIGAILPMGALVALR